MSRPISSLAPDIERRLAGWVRIQERLPSGQPVKLCPTVTLSREFGCEGFPVAERVKSLMEQASGETWNIFDKSLIEMVAKEEDIPLRLLKKLGDGSRAIEAFGLHASDHVTHDMAYEKVAKYLLLAAKAGNAVLVGRGSAILCRGMGNCFHFRLVAGFEWRVETLRKRMGLPREEAAAMVKENSRMREKFVTQCLGEDVRDPRFYDAIFNNEHHGVEQIAQSILAYVRSGWTEPGYFRKA